MRPRGRVGLHRAEDGLLDRLPHLGLGGDRRPATVSHRRSHLQLAPQPHDAEHQHQRPDHHGPDARTWLLVRIGGQNENERQRLCRKVKGLR
jgi:hypothetical protein